ncbi:MAG: MFS transporter [Candidatus Aquicultorales bacterium]
MAIDEAYEAQRKPVTHYGIWVLLAGVATIFGSIGLGRFWMGMIIPSMGLDLGLTNTQLGIIASGTFLGYLVSTFVSSALTLRFGQRRVIGVSMALLSVGMGLAAMSSSFPMAISSQLLIGTGSGGSNVPAVGLITRWFTGRIRGRASGLLTVGSGLGFAIAGTFVPYLMKVYGAAGWRMSWAVAGMLIAVTAAVGAFVFRDSPESIGLKPLGETASTGGSIPEDMTRKSMYVDRNLWKLGFVYLCFGFSYVAFTTFLAKYLIDQVGFSHVAAGRLLSVVGIASIASGFLWGALSDRIGRRAALFLVYLLQGVFLLSLGLLPYGAAVITTSILYALTLWAIPSVIAALCADLVGGARAAAALGMITVFFGVGQVASPWINGYLTDLTAGYALPYTVSAAASLAGAAMLLGFSRTKKQNSYS